MISINALFVEYEQNILNSTNNYENKVKAIEKFINNKKQKLAKKIASTRERYKKTKYKLSVLEKKAKKSSSKSLSESISNTNNKLFQISASLENLLVELEDIKTQQVFIKSSKAKSKRLSKAIKSIMMN